MADDLTCSVGVALIVEGATERVFYSEFVENRARVRGATIARVTDGDGTNFAVTRPDGTRALVKLNNVGTVTQMTNSAEWFLRSCAARHSDIEWSVFLGYDTDAYNSNITKFHEGDWARLRRDIEKAATSIVDLAAEADIEDIMLCDYAGVLAFLRLPADTPLPYGRKGKAKMRKLHRGVDPKKPYHEGDRALPLIRALDMDKVMANAPIPLDLLEAAIFDPRES